MQGPGGLLNVITIPPGASNTQARLVLDGVRGAIFVYQSGGPLGALIGSWAGVGGTDPYGNVYPAGINVASGSITGVVFNGINFVLNSHGLFFYSSMPALGNLIASISPTVGGGTDSFGNIYYQGFASYTASGGATATSAALLQGGAVYIGPPANFFTPFPFPGLFPVAAGDMTFQSGGTSGSDVSAQLELQSQNVAAGGFPVMKVNPSTTQISLQPGQGPFSDTGWHGVTLPSTGGFSGTIRVKLLPWNAVWLDVQVRWTGTTATTYTCGSLPSAGYYPTTGTPRFFNIVYGDTPNSDLLGNIEVPASGALSIFTTSSTSGSGTVGWYGCSVMYPVN